MYAGLKCKKLTVSGFTKKLLGQTSAPDGDTLAAGCRPQPHLVAGADHCLGTMWARGHMVREAAEASVSW